MGLHLNMTFQFISGMNMLKSNELNTVTKYTVPRLLQVKCFVITSMAKHFFDQITGRTGVSRDWKHCDMILGGTENFCVAHHFYSRHNWNIKWHYNKHSWSYNEMVSALDSQWKTRSILYDRTSFENLSEISYSMQRTCSLWLIKWQKLNRKNIC